MSECPRCRMKRRGMNHNTAHSPGCPNHIPPELRNQSTCPICEESFWPNNYFREYCRPCFEKWK